MATDPYGSGITIVEPIGCWIVSWGPDLIATVL